MLDCTTLDLATCSKRLADGDVSPVELTEAYLRRIEALNPRLNAYTTVCGESALEDARRAEAEIAAGRRRGPLHGVPIALKDLFETAGVRTTAGSKIFGDHVPQKDSTAARRLREAGAVLLGKVATHEFAYGVTTTNPHFGPTRNPWNRETIPGGSSGGSGAAIAAGLAAGTLGTDTGGSIRIPASLCGAVGLKPTYGRVSKAGVFPLSYIFDHPGPITHTVEDAAMLLQAIAGYDAEDPTTVRTPVDDYSRDLAAGVKGLRIGVPRKHFYDRLDDDVRAALDKALRTFRELGATIEDIEIRNVEGALNALFGLILAEARGIHADSLATRRDDFGADVLAILEQEPPSGAQTIAALRECERLTVAFRTALDRFYALVVPTTPIAATRIGLQTVRYGGAEELVMFAMIRCTWPFNATHLPAMSLPCGFTSSGLPIGMQVVAKPCDEATAIRVGHAYQGATDWHRRRPKL